jgi:hypothetical protein
MLSRNCPPLKESENFTESERPQELVNKLRLLVASTHTGPVYIANCSKYSIERLN